MVAITERLADDLLKYLGATTVLPPGYSLASAYNLLFELVSAIRARQEVVNQQTVHESDTDQQTID